MWRSPTARHARRTRSSSTASAGLVYRGQLDGTRPGNDLPVTAADVRAAVDAVLAGTPVPADQIPAMGCGIKLRHQLEAR
jgi:hypothetical protein